MPEGDVLRRTAAGLDAALAGHVLDRAQLRWPDAAGIELAGRTVLGTVAYGKHLLTRFDDGRTLHTHLRMEGSWSVHRTGTTSARERDPAVRAVLAAPGWTALGHRLGMLDVLRTRDEPRLLAGLGPDVLADDFPHDGLARVLDAMAADARPVAETLIDQGVLAGIGTIWMAESLFARRLWPWLPARDVPDAASLVMTARELMARAVAGHLTVRVHGRASQPCPRCGTPLEVGWARRPPVQRPVFWCPACQAPPRGRPGR